MKYLNGVLLYLGLGIVLLLLPINMSNIKYAQKGTELYSSKESLKNNYILNDYNVPLQMKNYSDSRANVIYNNKNYWVNVKSLSSNPENYNDNYDYSHYTRYNLSKINQSVNNPDYNIPGFKGMKIKDVPSTMQNKPEYRNITDSWPLQDSNSHEITYKGYHLVFALTGSGIPQTRIQLFYQKVGDEDKGLQSWHNAGDVITPNDNEQSQWAGTSILKNNKFRMIYTSVKKNGESMFSTAQLNIYANKNGVYVNPNKAIDHRTLLKGDGKYYEKPSQLSKFGGDDYGFRDPHYFEYNGHKYIIFQSSSGTNIGYQGYNSLYNMSNYGGDKQFNRKEQQYLLNQSILTKIFHKKAVKAQLANNVVGFAELDNNYHIKQIKKPLLGLNTTNDELERPNIFKHNGKWYLFGITRNQNFAANNLHSNTYMLGFVSDNVDGPFKPLNNNGVVLSSNVNQNARDYNYAHLILNNYNNEDNNFVVTNFMGYKTFGNSFILNINGDKTKIEHNKVMQQGAVTKNNAVYYNQSNK